MAELDSEEAAAASSGDGEAIQVYLRLKPSKLPSSYIKLAAAGTANYEDGDEGSGSGSDRRLPQVRANVFSLWFWQWKFQPVNASIHPSCST